MKTNAVHPRKKAKKNKTIETKLPEIGFVREAVILSLIPISRASWWAGVKAGKFPAPVDKKILGPRTTFWRVSDIREFIEKANSTEGAA